MITIVSCKDMDKIKRQSKKEAIYYFIKRDSHMLAIPKFHMVVPIEMGNGKWENRIPILEIRNLDLRERKWEPSIPSPPFSFVI